jgi:YebC/PmpR family DNA-binding regulatory protein
MSGHSKWANIRIRKGAQDAKRGKIYTKHAKLIEIAAQRGPDPASNASLRAAIENAKMDNVPNANIDRAIKKGSGELKGERMEELMLAALGPGGVACLIECLSDNRNRTLGNVKLAISKNGGTWTDSASVTWMFERKGQVVATTESEELRAKSEELELELIDFGAEDFSYGDGVLRVVTSLQNWQQIRDFLKKKGWNIESAGLAYIPTQKTAVTDQATAEKLHAFIDAVEEDEDVSEVHTNAEFVI